MSEYEGKKNLFIVESPAKTSKIQGFLGNCFQVEASVGHIRDLQKLKRGDLPDGSEYGSKEKYGIDVNNDFKAHYVIIQNKAQVYNKLRQLVQYHDLIWLAPDEDREGEAIAWHLKDALKIPDEKIKRVTFNEITKNAVCKSLDNSRTIDMNLVNAQQARRILDRLVGFELSPVLWNYFTSSKNIALSAGRVQSVAVRLVYDRENEIKNFISDKFIKLEGTISSPNNIKINITYPTNIIGTYQAYAYLKFINNQHYESMEVTSSNITEETKNPPPPYITSTLQQDASNKYGIPSKATMSAAQKLYEVGLITYMRTDSTSLSDVALDLVKEQVSKLYGEQHYNFRNYKTKSKGAQEAHEAIRPTHFEYSDLSAITDEKLIPKDGFTPQMSKLYNLIWKRTIASQIKASLYNVYSHEYKFTKYNIDNICSDVYDKYINENSKLQTTENANPYETFITTFNNKTKYRSRYKNLIYQGFLMVYGKNESENEDENENPNEKTIKYLSILKNGDILKYIQLTASEKETASKPRYTEASIVKSLEDKQIGRPSTYANIITTIMDRNYVIRETIPATTKEIMVLTTKPNNDITINSVTKKISAEKNKLVITNIGKKIVEFLIENFATIMDYAFTANMENKLDMVASGELDHVNVLKEFYGVFHPIVDTMLIKSKGISKISTGGSGSGSSGDVTTKPPTNRRLVGTHPTTNKNIYVLTAKYGNVVQCGDQNPIFASIFDKTIKLDEITLEQCLKFLELRINFLKKKKEKGSKTKEYKTKESKIKEPKIKKEKVKKEKEPEVNEGTKVKKPRESKVNEETKVKKEPKVKKEYKVKKEPIG